MNAFCRPRVLAVLGQGGKACIGRRVPIGKLCMRASFSENTSRSIFCRLVQVKLGMYKPGYEPPAALMAARAMAADPRCGGAPLPTFCPLGM